MTAAAGSSTTETSKRSHPPPEHSSAFRDIEQLAAGNFYTLCSLCAADEAREGVGKGGNYVCQNVAARQKAHGGGWTEENTMTVCCAVNLVARNESLESDGIKAQIAVLKIFLRSAS